MFNTRKITLLIGDIVVVIFSFYITLGLGFGKSLTPETASEHILPFALMYVLWIIILFIFNFYELSRVKPTINSLQRFFGALGLCLVIGVLLFYTVPIFGITPKTNLVINIVTFGLLLFSWRRLYYYLFSNRLQKRVLVVGISPLVQNLVETLKHNPHYGLQIIARAENDETLLDMLDTHTPELVIFGQKPTISPKILHKLFSTNTETYDVAHIYERVLHKIPVDSIDESWFLGHISAKENRTYEFFSQILSIVFSSIGLIISFPLLLMAALAIYLEDHGPIFYKQQRIGKHGKLFWLYKFRSMIVGADKNGAQWTEKNDPRITRIGSIIRKMHIDEVPQLFNVLRGDMSLTGPRPELPEFANKLAQEIPHYHLRHIVAPGFTGWAQIKYRNARGISESKEKFEYDLYYIKNRNFFLDLGIIMRTIVIVFTHD